MPILALLHTQGGPAQQVLFCINQHRHFFKIWHNSFKESDLWSEESKCCDNNNTGHNFPSVLHWVQVCAAFYNPKILPRTIQNNSRISSTSEQSRRNLIIGSGIFF